LKEVGQKIFKPELYEALILSDKVVYKRWLSELNDMEVAACPTELCKTNLGDIATFFKVEHFVYEKHENIRDKLVSVFHTVSSCGGSVLILINGTAEKIDYYFGARIPFGSSIDTVPKDLKNPCPVIFRAQNSPVLRVAAR
jgi:hypothetical protein